jgi:serine/threonine protein kinase
MIYCPTCFQENNDTELTCTSCQSTLLLRARYQLKKRLGKGGSSQVFLAFDQTENTQRAIKILQNASDWKGVEHFERQLSILQSLSHPGVPKIYEHFSSDEKNKLTFYSAQEFIEGESLASRIKRGHRYTEESARELLSQLVEILAYLHSLSPPVLHRDIKPQNIMIRPDETPVLIDFDTARGAALDKERADGTMVGTAGFVPMEQLAGQASAASDFYSLGMTMVAALSHKDVIEFPVERNRVKFEGFLNVSSGFQKILRKMTEPASEDRYQSAAALKQALRGEQPSVIHAAAPPPKQTEHRSERPRQHQQVRSPNTNSSLTLWFVGATALLGLIWFIAKITPAPTTFSPLTSENKISLSPPAASGEGSAVVESYQPNNDDFVKDGVVWASAVIDFSSQWGANSWSASRVAGLPNVFPRSGTNGNAWAPKETNSGFEWVTVQFETPVESRAVTVLETSYVGAIVRIDDMSDPKNPLVLWKGQDTPGDIFKSRAFRVGFKEPRAISALRVVLDTRINNSWEEIDAIGLIPKDPPSPEQIAAIQAAKEEKLKAAKEASKLPGGEEALAALSSRKVIWATSASASSEYTVEGWSAMQATGAPNAFPYCWDSQNAWAPREQDAGTESLTVSFPETEANGVILLETLSPGALTQIEDVSQPAQSVILWSGSPTKPEQPCRIVEIPMTPRTIKSLRFTFDTKNQSNWEEIDAIGLLPHKK